MIYAHLDTAGQVHLHFSGDATFEGDGKKGAFRNTAKLDSKVYQKIIRTNLSLSVAQFVIAK
jgi:hypothetical protein